METFRNYLHEHFRGAVRDDQQTLSTYSHDTSLFKVQPSLVVFPEDIQDLTALVAAVTQAREAGEDISLTGRSAGTDMSGGPLSTSVIVEFIPGFNKIKAVTDTYAITEPGVYYRDFAEAVAKHDLLFPSYPASKDICAMGGIVMNNSGGEKTLAYGKTANYVEAVSMVLADGSECTFTKLTLEELERKKQLNSHEGEIYRNMAPLIMDNQELLKTHTPVVSKNSAGYALWDVYDKEAGTFDLSRVVTGSQGTLGFMTSAKLRLVHPHTHSRLVVLFLNDLHALGEITNTLLTHEPESIESYDDKTMSVALKYFGDIVRRLKGNLITLGFSFLPEFFMVLTGGLPKLIVIAEFTADSQEDAAKKAAAAKNDLEQYDIKTHLTRSEKEGEKYWVVRRESFALLRKHTKGLRTAPFIDDIVVEPEHLPEFLPKLYSILDEYENDLVYTIAGHVGDGNFHIIPLMDLTKERSLEVIDELGERVYDLVLSYNGSITGEHNDGLIRSRYLPKMFGDEMYELFKRTKEIFDPENIFNPGKKVGYDETFVKAHIDTSVS